MVLILHGLINYIDLYYSLDYKIDFHICIELNSTSLEGKAIVTNTYEDEVTAYYRMLGFLVGQSVDRYKCSCTVFFIAEYLSLTTRTCAYSASLHSQVHVFINDVQHDVDVIRDSSNQEIEHNFDISVVKVSRLNIFGSYFGRKIIFLTTILIYGGPVQKKSYLKGLYFEYKIVAKHIS